MTCLSLRMLRHVASLAGMLLSVSLLMWSQAAPPSGDTFVSNAKPSVNFGNSPILVLHPGTTTYR